MTAPARRQGGFTLVELIIAIVVISVGLLGSLQTILHVTQFSADPLVRQQALAVAQSYLEEILGKAYSDPDAGGEATRDLFDDVMDYNGLSETPHDQNGGAIDGLGAYGVTVAVTTTTLNGETARRILVTVTHAGLSGSDVTLVGYRTDY